MSKRRRGGVSHQHVKRNVDKQIIAINQTVLAATQQNTLLWLATTQLTIVGLRWNVNFNNVAAAPNYCQWAIVLVREGNTPNALVGTDAMPVYAPEQNILVWNGRIVPKTADEMAVTHMDGHTKTMRKLQAGDQIRFIAATTDDSMIVKASVQFFTKI